MRNVFDDGESEKLAEGGKRQGVGGGVGKQLRKKNQPAHRQRDRQRRQHVARAVGNVGGAINHRRKGIIIPRAFLNLSFKSAAIVIPPAIRK